MIVNDVNVVNHDNAVVFVTEKNSLTADPRRFYITLPQDSFNLQTWNDFKRPAHLMHPL